MFVGNRKTKIYLLTITGIACIAMGFFLSNLKCKKIIEDNIFLGIEDGILEKRENIKKIEIPDGVTDSTRVKAIKKAWSCVDRVDTYDGYIVISCFVKKPETDILLLMKGV